jgi:hypothetical protein
MFNKYVIHHPALPVNVRKKGAQQRTRTYFKAIFCVFITLNNGVTGVTQQQFVYDACNPLIGAANDYAAVA